MTGYKLPSLGSAVAFSGAPTFAPSLSHKRSSALLTPVDDADVPRPTKKVCNGLGDDICVYSAYTNKRSSAFLTPTEGYCVPIDDDDIPRPTKKVCVEIGDNTSADGLWISDGEDEEPLLKRRDTVGAKARRASSGPVLPIRIPACVSAVVAKVSSGTTYLTVPAVAPSALDSPPPKASGIDDVHLPGNQVHVGNRVKVLKKVRLSCPPSPPAPRRPSRLCSPPPTPTQSLRHVTRTKREAVKAYLSSKISYLKGKLAALIGKSPKKSDQAPLLRSSDAAGYSYQ